MGGVLNTFQAIFPGVPNQVLQIMLYLPKYGKMFLVTLVQSHIYNFNNFGGLETNHQYMNIIFSPKSISKLPVFSIQPTITTSNSYELCTKKS